MGRCGNRAPLAAPHGVYQCMGDDRWISIAVDSEDKWPKFCQAIGQPALATQPEYATLASRKSNEDSLDSIVSAWTSSRVAEDAEATLQKADIPSNVVEKPSDIYKDPQLESRHYFTALDHPSMGRQKYEAQACFILSKTPRELTMPSPCVGEHNEYVFKELLKMTDEEIAEHLIDGSITTEFVGRMTSSF
jgi:crotonobetainyl-CoA:carnitine CoA-transferase CaiB-like acyl-CoA transferase